MANINEEESIGKYAPAIRYWKNPQTDFIVWKQKEVNYTLKLYKLLYKTCFLPLV